MEIGYNISNDNLEKTSKEIEKIFTKFDEKIKDKNDISDISQIASLLETINEKIKLMDCEKDTLKEFNKNQWDEKIKKIKKKYKECETTYKELERKKDEKENKEDPLTIEEAYKRGTNILDEDDKIIGQLIDIVSKDGVTCMIVKENLKLQIGELGKVKPMLKEMDFSLKRAGKKIKRMMIELSKDKIIICFIVLIAIIILAIIITSLFGGNKNYNNPVDIFWSNNNKNSTTAYNFSLGLFNKDFYMILFIFLLII